jgi:hypothetical protein
MNLAVLDYGLGNMYSVYRALDKLGVSFRIRTEGTEISPNETVMLPGVGSFGEGMRNLRASGQADALTAHHRFKIGSRLNSKHPSVLNPNSRLTIIFPTVLLCFLSKQSRLAR